MELMHASHQWATRPDDERFTSLPDLYAATQKHRVDSRAYVTATKRLEAVPHEMRGIAIRTPSGEEIAPTHWAFSQLAQRCGAPAPYMRQLPAPLAADCLNYGILNREVEDIGVLEHRPDGAAPTLSAIVGPRYGRVWNADIAKALMQRFGDGVSGQWKVPGTWGKPLDEVTKENTTLYASDRDMFVFLADETRPIEMENRRGGKHGHLMRGFFVNNSEQGKGSLGITTFLYDEVCANRIVWGARSVQTIKIRHSSGAPSRWLGEVMPAIQSYAEASDKGIRETIAAAQSRKLIEGEADRDKAMNEWLKKRKFSPSMASAIQAVHVTEEGRPIETAWDAATAITAYARQIPHTDTRVALEIRAGAILEGRAAPSAEELETV